MKDFAGGPDVEMPCFRAGAPGSILGQGLWSHMLCDAARNEKRDTIMTFKIPTVD